MIFLITLVQFICTQSYIVVIKKDKNVKTSNEGIKHSEMEKLGITFEEGNTGLEMHKQITSFDTELLCQQMNTMSVDQLLSFLKVSHKNYLSKILPEIEQSLLHITSRYSQTHHLLTSLAFFFNDYKTKLINHIRMEEKIVFPFIERLMMAERNELSFKEKKELLKHTTIQDFEDNHDPVEDELAVVSQVLFEYAEKTELPMPFRVFLNQVAFFELELRKHAAIEDEVLLPKILAIEKTLHSEMLK